MADEHQVPLNPEHPQAGAQQPQQAVQLPVDLSKMETGYSNFFRVTGTFEEVVLDFGLHTGMMTQSGPEAVKLSQRLVLSFPTAKRLLMALQMAVARHERLFGQVETDPQRRLRGQQPGGS